MKRILLIFGIAASTIGCKKVDKSFPVPSFTVTAEEMKDLQAGKSARYFDVRLPDKTVIIPLEGVDQRWEYSGLNYSARKQILFDTPALNPAFTSAAYMTNSVLKFGAGTVTANTTTKLFYENSASAYAILGRTMSKVTLNYPSISASIVYPAQTVVNSKKIFNVKYPLNLGNSWSEDNMTTTYKFIANAPSLGLINAPGKEIHTISYKTKVSGSGYMNLRGWTNGSFPVLVVREEMSTKVNYLINDNPLPAALLTASGFTDGAVTNTITYSFYSPVNGFLGTHKINPTTNKVQSSTLRQYF